MTKFSSRRTKKYQINNTQHEVNKGSQKTNKNLFLPKKLTKNINRNDNLLTSDVSIEDSYSELHSTERHIDSIKEQIEKEEIPKESSLVYHQIKDDLTNKNNQLESDVEEENYDIYFNKDILEIKQKYQQKKYLECISQLEENLKSKPSNLECVYWLGICCYQLGQLAKATECFVQASFSVETEEIIYVESFFWLGEIYRQQKELKIASQNYQKFLALAPKSVYSPIASKYLSEIQFELMFG